MELLAAAGVAAPEEDLDAVGVKSTSPRVQNVGVMKIIYYDASTHFLMASRGVNRMLVFLLVAT